MADDKAKAKDEAEPKATEPPARARDAEAKTYDVERVVAEAEAFTGHPPHVMAGALAEYGKKTITVDEARALADDWLTSPVKMAP